MTAASYDLVGSTAAMLRAYGPLTAEIGAGKVYLYPDANAVTPYVVMEDAVARRSDVTCVRSTTVDMNIHVYSDSTNALQDVRKIAGIIADAMHGHPLTLLYNRLVILDHRGERVFYDSNGTTGHAVVSFTAIIETP